MNASEKNIAGRSARRGFDTNTRYKRTKRVAAGRATSGWVDIAPEEKILDVRFMLDIATSPEPQAKIPDRS